jgi:hypothetical protein
LNRGAVRIPDPQTILAGALRLDLSDRPPLQRLPDAIGGTRSQRERDVVESLLRCLTHPDLFLLATRAPSDQRSVLLPGLQPEVLKEARGLAEIGHLQPVVMQS